MQQLSKQPAFELGQIVATPGALAALKKSGQQPGEFPRVGRFVRRGPQGKRLQPRARVPALPHTCWRASERFRADGCTLSFILVVVYSLPNVLLSPGLESVALREE